MSSQTIPACISILQLATQGVNQIQNVFDPNSKEFKGLKSFIDSTGSFYNGAEDSKASTQVLYIQMLFLIGLSMHGGIFVPNIKTIEKKGKNAIKIAWDNGATDGFTLGKVDEDFKNFANYTQSKLLGKSKKDLPV